MAMLRVWCLFLLGGFIFCSALGAEIESRILILGDSLTAGYGLDPSQAYPAILQEKIDAQDLDYEVVNAGVSGDTSAGGLRRIDWLLRRPVDVLVLELGANDGLRGIPLDATYSNLSGIIEKVKRKNPKVEILVAGMMVPPNLGEDYTSDFREMFRELASEHGAVRIPFLLEGVAGVPGLNLADGIHPTAKGHKLIAQTVWTYLKPLLEK